MTLNTDVVPLAMRIMDDIATAEEHYAFAERLAAMAQRLQVRAAHGALVIDGESIVADQNPYRYTARSIGEGTDRA